MSYPIDETHDPTLKSSVESANRPGSDFPIQNLPFGVFRRPGTPEASRIGVAIGDRILDLVCCGDRGLLRGLPDPLREACGRSTLNPLMALGRDSSSRLRRHVSELLRVETQQTRNEPGVLVGMREAELLVPAAIGDYTDFYASVFHSTNVGRMFRPDNPLLPNYKHLPIGYHGRASSILLSGADVTRPRGQRKGPEDATPIFGPSRFWTTRWRWGFTWERRASWGNLSPWKPRKRTSLGSPW